MAITAQPGWIVDPNNPNGVIRDPNIGTAPGGGPDLSQVTTPPVQATPATSPAGGTTIIPSDPGAPVPSPTGVGDQQFLGLLNGMNTGFQQNNKLVDQKQYVLNAILGNPQDPTKAASIPPDVQSVVASGNRDAMFLQMQTLNDAINNKSASVASSIQYLTTGYEASVKQAETNKQDALTSLVQLAQTFVDPKTGTVNINRLQQAFASLYPGIDVSGVISQLQGMMPVSEYNKQFYQGSLTTSTGSTIGSVGGYDLSSYATDPNYVTKVGSIAAQIGTISDPMGAQNYITAHFPGSPITGQMIMDAATKYGVDPAVIMGILQQESQFGTDGSKGALQNNFGNVGNTDSVMASGNSIPMNTPQDGVDAVAKWLAGHPAQNTTQDDKVAAFATGIKNGTITSIASIPGANMKALVAEYMAGNNIASPLGDRRYTQTSNSLIANYIAQPEYVLTQNALPYLLKIDAAMTVPGSVSDQELLDSFTKMSTAGGVITDAQVAVITGGRSLADTESVYQKKLAEGGVLSDDQRQQIYKLAHITFTNLKAGYQPIYNAASALLKGNDAQGNVNTDPSKYTVPQQFWTLPDLNSLSALSEAAVNANGATTTTPPGTGGATDSSSSALRTQYGY